ncbi:hypothetical protein LJC55_02895, partial [Eubacteriales bacterium OttesenSCG-928-N14]|nr:hypothetical protein [Eubacteriales bacterium OttesenSCG-928-N14]
MDKTLMKLILLMDNLPSSDPEYHMATNLLQNLWDIPNLSIEEMAERCYTSPATLSRFCKRLGFKSYVLFRSEFEPNLALLKQDRPIYSGYEARPETSPIERVVNLTIAVLNEVKQQLSFDEIEKAIDALHDAENIYMLGNELILSAVTDF